MPNQTPTDLYYQIVSSFIKSEQLIQEAWVKGGMDSVLEYHRLQLEHDVERQVAFLQAFLKAIRERKGGEMEENDRAALDVWRTADKAAKALRSAWAADRAAEELAVKAAATAKAERATAALAAASMAEKARKRPKKVAQSLGI